MRPSVRNALLLAACLAWPLPGVAADLTVTVRTPRGEPVANAVVTAPGRNAGPIRFPWPNRVAQQNLRFDPFVLIAPVGAEVAFPNLDRVRHHVYSFSAAHPFELKLYGRDETRYVRFDKPGVIALGCNIHDAMAAFILVVDTPFAAKTDAEGHAVLRGLPPGDVSLSLWHPYLRARGGAITLGSSVPRDGVGHADFTAELRPPPVPHRLY